MQHVVIAADIALARQVDAPVQGLLADVDDNRAAVERRALARTQPGAHVGQRQQVVAHR